MNLNDVDIFLKETDDYLKEYSKLFDIGSRSLALKINNEPYLRYERTLSSVANYFVIKQLKSLGYDVRLAVNEFAIKFTNDINYKPLIEEVGGTKKQWDNYCVVDGYFEIDNLISDKKQHIFVEYKLQNKFVFMDLATDYLKYKAYTLHDDSDTIFVYVVFDKENTYPTILGKKSPYYCLLDKEIDESSFNFEKRVFIHLPTKSEKNYNGKQIGETIELFNEIKCDSLELQNINESAYNDDEKLLIDKLPTYDSRVIKSVKIRKNYAYIQALWQAANEKNLFDKLNEIYDVPGGKVTTNDILNCGSEYRKYLANYIGLDAKAEAFNKGVRGSNYTSLFLISIFEYFKREYKINSMPPVIDVKRIGTSKRRSKEVNEQDAVNYYLDVLKKHFDPLSTVEKDKRLKRIVHSTLYYVTELYKIIYETDPNTGQLIEKPKYRMVDLLHNMQANINRVRRKIGFKDTIDLEKY